MRTSKYFFGKLFTTPPSVQKMRQRYEACCDRIQDSILIIEANMGTDERFSFDLNAAVAGIATCDLKVAGEAAKRYILIHEEYRCIIKMKSRREIERQIISLSTTTRLQQNLREARQTRRISSNPYSQQAPSRQEASNTPVAQ